MKKIIQFYIDGFKNMSKQGVKLWILILIKLFIMFVVLKIFFFNDFLDTKFSNDKEKSEYITNQLTK